ncbi:DNA/RNA helicase domain-containing protein [Bailinhaonella thermotolerans]|uniref:Transfer protein n=1 Tax=Bailinhaonella thermotolerans TaxID=1070861 RepID=A0A3A4A693_9ACTN|nr:DNA/RNA helicase domain-containing protein [Bailinhaonella thermotolerans]RJL20189.1 transfer protein [Bailinhaonella thermotolerans]
MSAPVLAAADEVVELMLEVPQGQVISYDLAALCSALDITDPTRIAVETDGTRRAIVTIYPSNPLEQMPPPSPQDMLMDRHGRIVMGRYHNGRPARRRLFDPRTGSAQRALVFGTTGAGKSRVVQYTLACEKRNRIVSWYGDLKGGQSAPEAEDHVDWYATSQEEVILMLRAAVAVAEARQRRYKALGRNAFILNDPDPLISVRVDEANRLLEKGSPYRDEGTRLVKELGRTGRSVGVGAELDAQASHLEELGGSDTLRAMLKEGEVTLLRWSSSMMRQLVADGLLPATSQLMPIPKTLRPRTLRSQFDPDPDDDEDDGPGTHGMGYLLSGPHPTALMRHWRIGSIAPTPGLDPEILTLYGPGEPARLETASQEAAGEAYAARHDPAAMAALCQTLWLDTQQAAVIPIEGGAASGRSTPRRPRLEDRLLAVLAAAENPMTAEDILDAVNADGGRPVRIGSIRNCLGGLADAGEVLRTERGRYAPAR